MRRHLWHFFGKSYELAAKPLLFMMSPDKAHHMMIKSTNLAGRVPAVRSFIKFIYSEKHDEILNQKYHGIDFLSPVGLAAGFDKNGEIVPIISRIGFGFATVGSVTALQCDGNPRPWFYRLPESKSLVINAGLANDGSDVIIDRIHNYSKKALGEFPVVLSVAKTNSQKVVDLQTGIDDYVTSIKRAKNEPRIKIIELNISCPNTYGGEPFTTPDRLEKLLAAVDKIKVNKPITIKMPIDHEWLDFKKLLDVIVKHDVKFVTISNLYKDRKSANLKEVLPESIKGNLSGAPTWERSNDLIRRTYKDYGDKLTIIGVGGIFTAEDAYMKIKNGASLVEIITGVIFNGPQLAAEISHDLSKMLKSDGYDSIAKAIGVDVRS